MSATVGARSAPHLGYTLEQYSTALHVLVLHDGNGTAAERTIKDRYDFTVRSRNVQEIAGGG